MNMLYILQIYILPRKEIEINMSIKLHLQKFNKRPIIKIEQDTAVVYFIKGENLILEVSKTPLLYLRIIF